MGEHRSLRAPVRVRKCLVNRTKCGEGRIRSRMALIARAETHAGFPRGLDRRRHEQINNRESDYNTGQRYLIEVPLFKASLSLLRPSFLSLPLSRSVFRTFYFMSSTNRALMRAHRFN